MISASWRTSAFAAGLAVAGSCSALTLGRHQVEAGPCSIAAAGSTTGNTAICYFGLTLEQLKQVTGSVVRGATEPLTRLFVGISKTFGVTEDAAKTLLKKSSARTRTFPRSSRHRR
jgi:hypothetical protein